MGSSPERAALLSPSRRRRCIDHVRQTLGVSERRACRTIGQHRSTQRKVPCGLPDEERLTDDIIELTREFGHRQETGRWLNNRVENSHLPFRRRERAMLRFRRMRSLQKFAAVHASVYNHFNQERSLSTRPNFKLNRAAALAEWRGLFVN